MEFLLDETQLGRPTLVTLSYDVRRFTQAMQNIVERIAAFQGRQTGTIPKALAASIGQFRLDLYPQGRELVLQTSVQFR